MVTANRSSFFTIAISSDPRRRLFQQQLSPLKSQRFFCPLFLLLVLLSSFFAPPLFAAPSRRKAGPPPLVKVAVITEENVNPPTEYIGHVEAIQQVDLRARVEGFIEQVKFKEGSKVKAGELLYIIEPAPYQAKVNSAKAQVAQAEATLQKNSRRLQRLQATRPESIRATDMDNAVAEELQAKAQLEEAKATLVRAELDLGYTIIKAPISGRIGRTAYTKGNLVNLSSGPLARIVQLDPIRVVYPVSENDWPAIQAALIDTVKGRKTSLLQPRIRMANKQIYKGSGLVELVDNQVDLNTGTIAIWARFKNQEGLLLPGQYVTALISRAKPHLMPVVPQAAVIINRQGYSVLVVDGQNKVTSRPLTTGAEIGTKWAVKSGLKVGEKVIIQGIQKVKPGQIVRIDTDKPATATGEK
jgi:membrane fusion protein (multidrug efflux system)